MKLDCLFSCSQLKEKKDEKSIDIVVIKQTNKVRLPTCLMNSLHILQGQFFGTQLLIRALSS